MSRLSIVIGTAGHIDHGKSALVKALTGVDPDRLKEEQERGITIDLGFAHCEVEGVNLALVDVPGHERFVRNMLAGVGGIDAVALVVACDESVMPQTREHFDICRLLRIPTGLVALTKADLVDEDTLDLVRLEVRELVAGSFLEGRPLIAVSSVTGRGLDEFRAALHQMAARAIPRAENGSARLPIDRVFSMRGFGTVVTGTLVSGTINAADELALEPGSRLVKVRGLQVHGTKRGSAVAGERVAVNLGGIEVAEIGRGDSLITPGAFEATDVLDAIVETLPGVQPLAHGARIRFHQGTGEVIGRVSVAQVIPSGGRGARRGAELDLAEAARRSVRSTEVSAGDSAFVRIRLEAPVVATRGDRFILRGYSPTVTVAGGQVLDPRPPRGATRTAAVRNRWDAISRFAADGEIDPGVMQMIEERGASGCTRARLMTRGGLSASAVAGFIRQATAAGRGVLIGEVVISPAALDELERQLLDVLGAYHRAEPLSEGMAREAARDRVFARAEPVVFEFTVASLSERGLIVARDRLALAAHRVALPSHEAGASATVEGVFRNAGLTPPDVSAAAEAASIEPAVVNRVVTLLLRQKTLVKLAELLFHQEALQRLKQDVAALKASGTAHIDMAAFKQRYGVTRKYAIPLLEYLDRERVTRRLGDKRVIL